MTDMTLLPVPTEVVRAFVAVAPMSADEHRADAERSAQSGFGIAAFDYHARAAALEADLPPVFKKGDRVKWGHGVYTVASDEVLTYNEGMPGVLVQGSTGQHSVAPKRHISPINEPQPGDPVDENTPVGTWVENSQSGSVRTLDAHVALAWKCERPHCPAHSYDGWVVAAPEDEEGES